MFDTAGGGGWFSDNDTTTNDPTTMYTYDDPYNASLIRKIQYPDGDKIEPWRRRGHIVGLAALGAVRAGALRRQKPGPKAKAKRR